VLLRVSFTAGHGQGTALSERIEQTADTYTFLMKELSVR
jgi:prolyl oligopeptidase PreP (S9A serine peptidase family)